MTRGPFEVKEAVRIAAAIAKGLGHAHAQGVVHRDLKPSNVFICENGEVKLLDFGMSHAFGHREIAGGTPAYMAPEQRRGAPEDERTDVFALGVILFEMLAARLPFSSGDGPSTAPTLDAPAPPSLVGLVSLMLRADPTERPRDGNTVATALGVVLKVLEGDAPTPLPPPPPRRQHRWTWPISVAIAIPLTLAVALGIRSCQAEPSPPRAIAVLPFKNLSGSEADEYFSDGLTEEILHRLTRLRELKVAGSASSYVFKNRDLGDAEIARRLGVDALLRGSVRRDGDRLRVAVELTEPRSGFRLWSQMYDRRREDVFAIQDDIARQVAGALELVLSRAFEGELGTFRAARLDAYDTYLRGRAALRLPRTEQNLDEAIALFEQALAADGQFGPAHAGLCDAWLRHYELRRSPQSFEKGQAACRRTLELNHEAADAYVALGNLQLLSGNAAQAEKEFRHATEIASSPADGFLGLASAYEAQQRFEEAERTFDAAKRIDPGYWLGYQLHGLFLYHRGRYAEAAREYSEVIARTPDNANAYNNLGAAHFMARNLEQAADAWRRSLELAPSLGAYSNTGSSYFYLRRFEDAAAMYRRAIELAPNDHRLWGNLGDAYARLPERDAEKAAAYRKAISLGEQRLAINRADARTLANLAAYYASLKQPERAQQLKEEALRLEPQSMDVHYYAALVAVRLGAGDAALDELERAIALGYPRQLVLADAGLDPVRHHPRFGAMTSPTDQHQGGAP
jgi:TolB-like protein/Tfp pilus assembly protein PilF